MNTTTAGSADGSGVASALMAVDEIGNALKMAVYKKNLVQSNKVTGEMAGKALSIPELEQQARTLRAAFVLRTFKAMILAVENWFARRAQSDLEDYLAASQNLADLESRMRRYADKQTRFNLAGLHYD